MQKRPLICRLSRESKKLLKGDQSPQNDWKREDVLEVKVTTRVDGPVINLAVGKGKVVVTWCVDSGAARTVMDDGTFKKIYIEIF